MDLGIFFWVLIIIGFVGWGWTYRGDYQALGIGSIPLLLIVLLGLKVYPLHV